MSGRKESQAPSDGAAVVASTHAVREQAAEELAAFLALRRIGAFADLLGEQEVTSLDEFAELVGIEALRKSLRQAFINGKAPTVDGGPATGDRNEEEMSAGHRAALAAFDALDAKRIDRDVEAFRKERMPPPPLPERVPEARYRATEELKSYLVKEGFPEESVPLFEEHGAYSVRSLQDLCASGSRKDALESALRTGGVAGGKRLPASESAANRLKGLSSQDIESGSRPGIQADTVMSKEAQARRRQLEEAIAKVEELRQACVSDASANLTSVKKRAETELAAMLERAGVGGVLSRLDKGAFVSLGTLNAALADIGKNLGDAIGKEQLTKQRDEPSLDNDKLVEYNGLRHGVVLTVAGVRDACGAELLDAAASVSYSNEGYRESIAQFDSESSYQYAEKTVERSSSAFSTSERVSGGGIGQSGLFALSAAGSYARARYEQKESTAGGRRSQASKLAVRKIEMTSARVRLPWTGVRLGREAAGAVARLAMEADEARAQERARDFIDAFGSHLFCETRLGGRYKSVVRAEALAEDGISMLSRAASLAAGWKASGAATYVGLNFLASAATANEGDKAQAEGFSKDERDQLKSVRIDISSHAVGGLPGLSADLWKYSLGKNQNWRVIDRLQPVAAWSLLRDAACDLSDEHRDLACRRLERSWVRDYFLPDLVALDAELKSNEALMKAESVAALVEAVAGLLSPPPLRLCCFRHRFAPSRTLRCALELPEHYKILSGGASTLKTDKGNFLISSYPSYDPMLRRWAWHAEMRDIRHASNDAHEIAVIAVYDPDDEWDVRLFASQSQSPEARHSELAIAESGYLVTGGGGRIDRFGWAALTQCGLEPGVDGVSGPGFRAASRSCLKDSRHQLTAIAVGLKPRNGTRLVPVYPSSGTGEEAAHPDVKFTRKNRGDVLLGGGVITQPEGDNFLLGSCPMIGDSDEVAGWKASGKDHEHAAKVGMTVTMVGVANVALQHHVPPDKAQLREDSAQFCMQCGHVGPWRVIEVANMGTTPHKIINNIITCTACNNYPCLVDK